VDEHASLEDLFERFESLPSRDAEDAKREVVERVLAAIAGRLAEAGVAGRYRSVRAASARVRLLSPGAEGFDDAVLDLIDAARPVRPAQPPPEPAGQDAVTEASEGSFPASDPPGFVAGGDGSR
jgi:hypothetical protein